MALMYKFHKVMLAFINREILLYQCPDMIDIILVNVPNSFLVATYRSHDLNNISNS